MNSEKRARQNRTLVGAVIFMVTTVGAALFEWELPDALSHHVLLAIAALGGGVAGRILAETGERMRAHLAAMLGGVLGALGGFYALARWLDGRSSVGSAEATLAMVIGAAPGLLVGAVLYGRLRRRADRVPPAKLV
jgi:hypothetical protein